MQDPNRPGITGQEGSKGGIHLLCEAIRAVAREQPTSSAAQSSEPQPRKAPVKRGRRCKGCARWKVRCSEQLPCERCFAMCLPCEPQCLAEGQPFVELAITTIDPKQMNVAYMQAFHKLHAAGNINRQLFMRNLLMWQAMSFRARRDVTHGLFDEICRVLSVSKPELGTLDEQLHADSERIDDAEIPPLHEAMSREVEQSQTFQRLDDGVSLLMVAVSCKTGVFMAMNKVAGDKFCTSQQCNAYLETYAMLPVHILASMVAPDDRSVVYELQLAAYSTTPPSHRTGFVKFCERTSEIELFILRVRFIELPEITDAHLVTVLTLERAPSSRHITRRPGHHHHIVESFRLGRTGSGTDTGQEAGSPSRGPVMPGMVCFPGFEPIEEEKARELFESTTGIPPPPITPSTTRKSSIRTQPSSASSSLTAVSISQDTGSSISSTSTTATDVSSIFPPPPPRLPSAAGSSDPPRVPSTTSSSDADVPSMDFVLPALRLQQQQQPQEEEQQEPQPPQEVMPPPPQLPE